MSIMKILFLSGLYPPTMKGGGELSTHYIARGLTARGHEVTVLAEGPQRVESHLDGVRVFRAPFGLTAKPLFEAAHSRRVASAVAREVGDFKRFDVVHAHDFRSALALSHLHLPQGVVTVRDYAQISGCTNNILYNGSINPGCSDDAWHCHRVQEVGGVRRLLRLWQHEFNIGFRHAAFRSLPRHIFISRSQQQEIERHQKLPGVKTKVIYNPVSPEYTDTPLVAGRPGTILYIGRTEMYKGVGLLLDAFQALCARHSHIKLVIAGQGAQQGTYEQEVAKRSLQYRVQFLGHVAWDRVKNVYDEADVVVSPHLWVEPFGRSIVEGMARGKLVVAANCGGPAEIIKTARSGMLFERGDVKDLSRKLQEALLMNMFDRREMGRRGREWVTSALSLDRIAQEHEEIYSQ